MPTLEGQNAGDFDFSAILLNFVRVPLKMSESPAECGRVGNYATENLKLLTRLCINFFHELFKIS